MGLSHLRELMGAAREAAALGAAAPARALTFIIECKAAPDLTQLDTKLTEALQSGFALGILDAESPALSHFVTLTIERVENCAPNAELFDIAYELRTLLGVRSVEPDIRSRAFPEAPPPDGDADQEAAAVDAWCNVHGAPPANIKWALDLVRAPLAWALNPSRGEGIIVAQPDTGVVPTHAALQGALKLDKDANLLEPGTLPIDPLSASMANPFHGSATGSCVAARETFAAPGTAPRASLYPIRCINDVKVFEPSPVARAISLAVRKGAHVITMSLGGVASRALAAAINEAVEANVVVLAAAGNCVKTVVWPARYGNCIAVAGVNSIDKPWKGTCQGDAVDFAAPAEQVYKADVKGDASDGQGTSFAVALTAGVAALWLSHHKRDALLDIAEHKGVKLQNLFMAAARASARRPKGWKRKGMGAGVIDAEALLKLDPKTIDVDRPELETPEASIEALVREAGPKALAAGGVNLQIFGMEVASILLERARRKKASEGGSSTEAGGFGDRPSKQLQRALKAADAAPARRLLAQGTPAHAPLPHDDAQVLSDVIRVLGGPRRGSIGQLESTAPITPLPEARETLHKRPGDILDIASFRMRAIVGENPSAAQSAAIDKIMSVGKEALAIVGSNRPLDEIVKHPPMPVLEAIVSLTGRPALLVKDDAIDIDAPEAREWHSAFFLMRARLSTCIEATGRIDAYGVHIGTGSLIGPNVVMTNRHVLEHFASPAPTEQAPLRWALHETAITIDFKREKKSRAKRMFRIVDVLFAGPNPTNDTTYADFNDLDLALLEIAELPGSQATLPAPVGVYLSDFDNVGANDLMVVGYPAKPDTLPRDAHNKVRIDVVEALSRIYGGAYGQKFVSPGLMTAAAGSLPKDPHAWVFNHDASTLAGNSGSPVFPLTGEAGVIGLHFAGALEKANHAHLLIEVLHKRKTLKQPLAQRILFAEAGERIASKP